MNHLKKQFRSLKKVELITSIRFKKYLAGRTHLVIYKSDPNKDSLYWLAELKIVCNHFKGTSIKAMVPVPEP